MGLGAGYIHAAFLRANTQIESAVVALGRTIWRATSGATYPFVGPWVVPGDPD
jgi:hypothetical protein